MAPSLAVSVLGPLACPTEDHVWLPQLSSLCAGRPCHVSSLSVAPSLREDCPCRAALPLMRGRGCLEGAGAVGSSAGPQSSGWQVAVAASGMFTRRHSVRGKTWGEGGLLAPAHAACLLEMQSSPQDRLALFPSTLALILFFPPLICKASLAIVMRICLRTTAAERFSFLIIFWHRSDVNLQREAEG